MDWAPAIIAAFFGTSLAHVLAWSFWRGKRRAEERRASKKKERAALQGFFENELARLAIFFEDASQGKVSDDRREEMYGLVYKLQTGLLHRHKARAITERLMGLLSDAFSEELGEEAPEQFNQIKNQLASELIAIDHEIMETPWWQQKIWSWQGKRPSERQ